VSQAPATSLGRAANQITAVLVHFNLTIWLLVSVSVPLVSLSAWTTSPKLQQQLDMFDVCSAGVFEPAATWPRNRKGSSKES